MLAGVATKEFFVELAADCADHHVLRRTDLIHCFATRGEELLELFGRQFKIVELVDRVEVDWDRQQLTVDF